MSSIYVLGWGSLIWNPGKLKLHARHDWQEDGPHLPIEFARISSRDRLTLVRKKGAAPVQVLWHKMNPVMTLHEALESLRVREGCSTTEPIGFVDVRSGRQRCRDEVFASVVWDWANEKGADQVIWTDLGVNFKHEFGVHHTPKHAIKYLKSLADTSYAREYVEKAPAQIVTPVRTEIARVLRWGGVS